MARRKFSKLKVAMYEAEITQEDVAREIRRSMSYVVRRMNGQGSFNIDEIRTIGTLLHIDRAQLLDYFMEDGAKQ